MNPGTRQRWRGSVVAAFALTLSLACNAAPLQHYPPEAADLTVAQVATLLAPVDSTPNQIGGFTVPVVDLALHESTRCYVRLIRIDGGALLGTAYPMRFAPGDYELGFEWTHRSVDDEGAWEANGLVTIPWKAEAGAAYRLDIVATDHGRRVSIEASLVPARDQRP